LRILVALVRTVVRAFLYAHPPDFRRRFGRDILDDVEAEVRGAAPAGSMAAMHAAGAAIADAIESLRSAGDRRSKIQTVTAGSREARVEKMHPRARLSEVWRDVRLGLRAFVREPSFSASVVLTLALGIGVNTAMFGVVDRLLLRGPEHVRDAERLR